MNGRTVRDRQRGPVVDDLRLHADGGDRGGNRGDDSQGRSDGKGHGNSGGNETGRPKRVLGGHASFLSIGFGKTIV